MYIQLFCILQVRYGRVRSVALQVVSSQRWLLLCGCNQED